MTLFRICTLSIILSLSLLSCGSDDPCDNITCEYGSCANGECDCDEMHEGPSCAKQKTPSKIVIRKVIAKNVPSSKSDGTGWDIGSSYDPYFILFEGDNAIYTSTFPTDFGVNQPIEYRNVNIEITDVMDQHTIALYDKDGLSNDDFIGGYYFMPYSTTNNFPSVIDIDLGNDLGFELYIEYQF